MTDLAGAIIGAFVGSFSAFIFFLLGEALSRGYQRVSAGRNALVFLERVLNEQLDASYVFGNQAAEARVGLATGQFVASLPRSIDLPDGLDRDLMDRECVNRLFSLKFLLRRCNVDAENLKEVHDRLVALLLEGRIDGSAFAANAQPLGVVYGVLATTVRKQYTDEVEAMLARVRVLLRRPESKAIRFVGFVSRTFMVGPILPPTAEEVATERRKLAEEVASTIGRGRPSDLPGAQSQQELQAAIEKAK